MMIQLQIVAALILLLAFLYIVNLIRKRKLELKYALAWMLVITAMLIADLFPPILNILSYLLGIATPVNTLFLLGFVFSIGLLFILTVAVSRLADKARRLSQAVAIGEEQRERLEQQVKMMQTTQTTQINKEDL
ncbi:MAG: DUF2304 domain-containing protein [Lachnospiraceae bacterium]